MKNSVKYSILLGVGFALGLFIFFPWNLLKMKVVSLAAGAGAQLNMRKLSGGIGLGAGWTYGALLGVHAEDMQIVHPAIPFPLECDNVSLAPQILPYFWGQMRVGFSCDLKGGGELSGLLKIKPFWSMSSVSLSINTDELPLSLVDQGLGTSGFAGTLSGDIEVTNLNTTGQGLPEEISWDIEAEEVQTPPLNHAFLKLPSFAFSELVSRGTFESRKIVVEKLNFGSAANPVEGQFQINFGLNSRMEPVKGQWTGKIRVEPEFEAQRFKDLNLNLLFGTADSRGQRSFVKPLEGSVMSLLRPPKN